MRTKILGLLGCLMLALTMVGFGGAQGKKAAPATPPGLQRGDADKIYVQKSAVRLTQVSMPSQFTKQVLPSWFQVFRDEQGNNSTNWSLDRVLSGVTIPTISGNLRYFSNTGADSAGGTTTSIPKRYIGSFISGTINTDKALMLKPGDTFYSSDGWSNANPGTGTTLVGPWSGWVTPSTAPPVWSSGVAGIGANLNTPRVSVTSRIKPSLVAAIWQQHTGTCWKISGSAYDTGVPTSAVNVTGATNATPVVLTMGTHGLVDGDYVTVSGVGGNTAANGSFYVDQLSSTTCALYTDRTLSTPVAGNGAYTSGGTWVTYAKETPAFVIDEATLSNKVGLRLTIPTDAQAGGSDATSKINYVVAHSGFFYYDSTNKVFYFNVGRTPDSNVKIFTAEACFRAQGASGTVIVYNVDFEGPMAIDPSSGSTLEVILYNCTGKYGNFDDNLISTRNSARGWWVNCDFRGSSGNGDVIDYDLDGRGVEINVYASDAGTAGSVTSNPSTCHNTGSAIRINGRYERCYGRILHDADSAQTVNLGCYTNNTIGQLTTANAAYGAGVASGDTVVQYIADAKFGSTNLLYAYYIQTNSNVYIRNCPTTLATTTVTAGKPYLWGGQSTDFPPLAPDFGTIPITVTTASGNITLYGYSNPYQLIDTNGTDRDVTLDATTNVTGRTFTIRNTGANTITIKNSGGSTVTTVSTGASKTVVYSGAAWVAL